MNVYKHINSVFNVNSVENDKITSPGGGENLEISKIYVYKVRYFNIIVILYIYIYIYLYKCFRGVLRVEIGWKGWKGWKAFELTSDPTFDR